MNRHRGRPRKLTDPQIRRVLLWHARWQKFRRQHQSQRALAQRIGVKKHVVADCIARYRRRGSARALSTVLAAGQGRPKALRHREARAVIAWYLRYRGFLVRYGSAKTLALRIGVSERTISDCIHRRGCYRQLSQQQVAAQRVSQSRDAARSSAGTRVRRATDAETRLRSTLLNQWRQGRR
jgi:transposase